MHYYIYRNSDNELISDSADVIAQKEGYTVISFEDRQAGIWNKETLSFDPYQEVKRYPKSTFYKNVGIARFGKVMAASKNDIEVETLLEYIKGLDNIEPDDPELVYGISLLVAKGVWTQAEADEVLS